LKKRIQD